MPVHFHPSHPSVPSIVFFLFLSLRIQSLYFASIFFSFFFSPSFASAPASLSAATAAPGAALHASVHPRIHLHRHLSFLSGFFSFSSATVAVSIFSFICGVFYFSFRIRRREGRSFGSGIRRRPFRADAGRVSIPLPISFSSSSSQQQRRRWLGYFLSDSNPTTITAARPLPPSRSSRHRPTLLSATVPHFLTHSRTHQRTLRMPLCSSPSCIMLVFHFSPFVLSSYLFFGSVLAPTAVAINLAAAPPALTVERTHAWLLAPRTCCGVSPAASACFTPLCSASPLPRFALSDNPRAVSFALLASSACACFAVSSSTRFCCTPLVSQTKVTANHTTK